MRLRERQVSGLEYLDLVTALLQTARRENPTGGVWEAADLQWWWRRDQHIDPAGQTFWFDDGTPCAVVVFMNWGDRWGCDLIGARHDLSDVIEVVWPRALEGIAARRGKAIEMTIRDDDAALIALATAAGFAATDEVGVTTSMHPPNIRRRFLFRTVSKFGRGAMIRRVRIP